MLFQLLLSLKNKHKNKNENKNKTRLPKEEDTPTKRAACMFLPTTFLLLFMSRPLSISLFAAAAADFRYKGPKRKATGDGVVSRKKKERKRMRKLKNKKGLSSR